MINNLGNEHVQFILLYGLLIQPKSTKMNLQEHYQKPD